MKYDHKVVEKKWGEEWSKKKIYTPDLKSSAKKFYNLMMFPYPSAEGLHAGNMFAFTGSDVYGRFQRMQGNNVFEPIGLDGFGIHSENYALKVGRNPKDHAQISEKNYYKQLKLIGNGFDWDRTLETYDPEYYKGTQWLFTQMFKAGLAYKGKAWVNWCPGCKTVLADEQIMTPVQAGKVPPGYSSIEEVPEGVKVCERCGNIPERKELSQWFFRITDYADRLLEGLNHIEWTEKVKIAQKEWIGKKTGINITFKVKDFDKEITVFTTTPINFGATFLVVAPEYAKANLLDIIPKEKQKDVSKYIETSLNKSELKRKEDEKDKTGAFTGLYVENHVTGKPIPVWIADFVLMGVGTGAVQGCPGHDKRDFDFAKKFDIPIPRVVVGKNGEKGEMEEVEQVHIGEKAGVMINSDFLNGIEFTEAMEKTKDFFEEKGWGKRVSTYHLRNWLISRQRYWGPPIPMIYCEHCAKEGNGWIKQNKASIHEDQSDWDHAGWYPEENLPVELPTIDDFKPGGEGMGPLANHPEFYKNTCPGCGKEAKRETDVSDTFVDSSWYFLQYPTVGGKKLKNSQGVPWDKEITQKWLPVDQYFGGAEHSVLHLMYARFVTYVLYDLKFLSFEEPFPKFYAHGLMVKDGAKMSKSKGNVVNPDEYIVKFGADTLRLYLMFMGPMDGSPDFRDTGIEGMSRFIKKVWELYQNISEDINDDQEITVKMHQTIKKVTQDVASFNYNTAISALMTYVNLLQNKKNYSRAYLKPLVQLIAPFAPHVSEEIWVNILKEDFSIHNSAWPVFDPELAVEENRELILMIDGKPRSQMNVPNSEFTKEEIIDQAKKDENIKKWLEGKEIKNIIYVSKKLLNFVTEK